MDLQELIARGRFLMSDAPDRLKVFELVNGQRTAKHIAAETGRRESNISRDLKLLVDGGLLQAKAKPDGSPFRLDGGQVFEKVPLARTVPMKFFRHEPATLPKRAPARTEARTPARRESRKQKELPWPDEKAILSICKEGEDQDYEFKGQGTEPRKISREVGAMLHSPRGGLIFYGVDDDGTVQGTDVSRQKLDQSIQNAVKNSIDPPPKIALRTISVLGSDIIAIAVPPWNHKDVYFYEGRVLLRKGTNVFQATSAESRRLHNGEAVT